MISSFCRILIGLIIAKIFWSGDFWLWTHVWKWILRDRNLFLQNSFGCHHLWISGRSTEVHFQSKVVKSEPEFITHRIKCIRCEQCNQNWLFVFPPFEGNVIDRHVHFHQTFYLALDRQLIKLKVDGMLTAKGHRFGINSLIPIQRKLSIKLMEMSVLIAIIR